MSKYTNVVTTIGFGKATANVGTDLMSMKKGDVLIIDARTGAVITAISASTAKNYPAIQVATCVRDGQPILSAEIKGDGVLAASKFISNEDRKLGSKVVGYSPAVAGSVSIPTYSEDVSLQLSVIVSRSQQLNQQRQYRKDVVAVGLGGVDGALDIVAQLGDDSDNNPVLPGDYPVVGAVVTDGTLTPIATMTATLQNQSDKLVQSVAGVAVGDYIQIGTTASIEDGSGEDISGNGGVFKVVGLNGLVATLDHKNYGASVSGVAVNKVSAIVKTGIALFPRKAQTKDNPVASYNQLGKFQVALSETFSTAGVSTLVEPVEGEGYGWILQDTEVKCMGYNGFTDRLNPMRQGYQFQAITGEKYNQIAISNTSNWNQSEIGVSYGTGGVIIAFPADGDTQRTAVSAILRPWLEYFGLAAANTAW